MRILGLASLLVVVACGSPPKPEVLANRTVTRATQGVQYVGDPNASLAITYYFDYECPHCFVFAPQLDEIERRYGNRIVVHYKNFQLAKHPTARLAAIGAEAARRQGKFIEMHRLLMQHASEHQTPEAMIAAMQRGDARPETFTPAVLRELAAKLALDLVRFDADVADASAGARVDAEYAEGDQRGVDSVPVLYFGDTRYDGALDVDAISAEIEPALRR